MDADMDMTFHEHRHPSWCHQQDFLRNEMESEGLSFFRRILDEVGDRRDVAAREEDGDIVFPSPLSTLLI